MEPKEENPDFSSVFANDFQILERAKAVSQEDTSLPGHWWFKEYSLLATHYEKLLEQLVQITRLGDKFQGKLLAAHEKYQQASRTDPLTQLANRRYILEKIEAEQKRFKRHGKSFTLVLSDIDNFKHFNDQYGHECGDFVLVNVGMIMHSVLRETDSTGRWGGEEFILLLPETSLTQGISVAEKVRETINGKKFSFKGHEISITMTFGVSTYSEPENIDECIKRADQALYLGKSQGKNCVMPPPRFHGF